MAALSTNAHQIIRNSGASDGERDARRETEQPEVDDRVGPDDDAEANGVECEDGGVRPDAMETRASRWRARSPRSRHQVVTAVQCAISEAAAALPSRGRRRRSGCRRPA